MSRKLNEWFNKTQRQQLYECDLVYSLNLAVKDQLTLPIGWEVIRRNGGVAVGSPFVPLIKGKHLDSFR